MTTLYAGNLPLSATGSRVRGLFEQNGPVLAMKIACSREPCPPCTGLPEDGSRC